ncbi:hypothetical protein NDU88_003287 [Pleurodeles waltl]|uniref:Uncharacterized protein n=1 Tax=Pleurodeles waltl TaxID=8319 RepID=A0AAV7QF19_PLEWA|nr:hypothetical protein NDU88_003287 [Pleurodeles waltl]
MARATGEQDPAFTAEELEKLVDGVSAHQKRGLWQAIAKEVQTLGVYNRHSLQEAVEGPEALGQEDRRGPAGEGLPTRKGCLLDPDPPNGPHSGSGISGFGWALEGSTAATRGGCWRTQNTAGWPSRREGKARQPRPPRIPDASSRRGADAERPERSSLLSRITGWFALCCGSRRQGRRHRERPHGHKCGAEEHLFGFVNRTDRTL